MTLNREVGLFFHRLPCSGKVTQIVCLLTTFRINYQPKPPQFLIAFEKGNHIKRNRKIKTLSLY